MQEESHVADGATNGTAGIEGLCFDGSSSSDDSSRAQSPLMKKKNS
jgi:hypothetical protein